VRKGCERGAKGVRKGCERDAKLAETFDDGRRKTPPNKVSRRKGHHKKKCDGLYDNVLYQSVLLFSQLLLL